MWTSRWTPPKPKLSKRGAGRSLFAALPEDCPPHLQFLYNYDGPIGENNSLFVSVSRPGDGRAPVGQATIIASTFTEVGPWWQTQDYAAMKQAYTDGAIRRLSSYFDLDPKYLIHVEAATPRTFAHFTALAWIPTLVWTVPFA